MTFLNVAIVRTQHVVEFLFELGMHILHFFFNFKLESLLVNIGLTLKSLNGNLYMIAQM